MLNKSCEEIGIVKKRPFEINDRVYNTEHQRRDDDPITEGVLSQEQMSLLQASLSRDTY